MNTSSIPTRLAGDVRILDIGDSLDCIHGCGAVQEAVERLLQAGETRILLNTGNNTIGKDALGELVLLHANIVRAGGQFRLVCVCERTRAVVQRARLSQSLQVHATESSAILSFSPAATKRFSASEYFIG